MTRKSADTAVSPTRPADRVQLGLDRRPHLLAFCRGQTQILHLEEGQRYVVGRSSEADLAVDDSLVSRQHLEVLVQSGGVSVNDLGSSNGTRLNGELIDGATALSAGDVVSVGVAQIVLHLADRPTGHQPVLDPAGFAHRLDAEMERSLRYGRPLTLLVVDAGGGRDGGLEDALGAGLRAMDQLGRREGGGFALVLPELPAANARRVAERILQRARRSLPAVRAGMASWPEDAHDAGSLQRQALAAMLRAAPGELHGAEGERATLEVGGERVVFADPGMLQLVELMKRLAPTDLPVLITGETGAGKEIFARGLHDFSGRAAGPFVAVNCAALPENLAESELFGHARGAFTGATGDREGKLAAASGGTLFLDEIGDMPAAVQAKLLRVLEDRAVVPLGENRSIAVDIRLVAATNRDLKSDADAGSFRLDLYYRVSGASLAIPPLRERPGDVRVLVELVSQRAAERLGRPPPVIDPTALHLLARYPWPGNVRELRNVVELAVATSPDGRLEAGALPPELLGGGAAEPPPPTPPHPLPDDDGAFRPLADQVRALEKVEIERALRAAGGVRKKAAELLDMPLRTLHAKLKQYPDLADALPAPSKRD